MSPLKETNRIKNLIIKKENIYFLIIIIFTFCFDRFTKIEIIDNYSDSELFINEYLNFSLIWNTGIGFGLLSFNTSIIYNLITFSIGIVILILFYFYLISEKSDKMIFSFIIGGALGNYYDRLYYNAVPDFIDLHYGSFHWFVFNIADVFITIGVVCLIFAEIFFNKKQSYKDD